MFQKLFTPLVARFDIGTPRAPVHASPNGTPRSLDTPRSLNSFNESESIDVDPEDFARDVIIELMRNAVDRLKGADDIHAKLETLAEIHRILHEDACTKDVFREMDGFLVLIGVLSTLHATTSEERTKDVLEGTRLSTSIVSDAIKSHKENATYFETRVGYDSFSEAIHPLLQDQELLLPILDQLLSLSLASFPTTFFTALGDTPAAQLESHATELATPLPPVRNPGALKIVWDGVHLPPSSPSIRFALYKLLERLLSASHRSHILLSALGLSRSLFTLYHASRAPETTVSDRERSAMARLLRRLLEPGVSSTTEAREIFRAAVGPTQALDADVLEVIRGATKAKWPPHFSLEPGGALLLDEDGVRGLPTGGTTFMAWVFLENLPPEGTTELPVLFGLRLPSKWVLRLSLRPDGSAELWSGAYREPVVLARTVLPTLRWAHLALVYHSNRATNPTVRMFVDGALTDAMQWVYPKLEPVPQTGTWILGDTAGSPLSWSLASAHVLSMPLSDDVLRLVHHLSPRYAGTFQSAQLAKMLTYESATSLSIHLYGLAAAMRTSAPASAGGTLAGRTPLMKALRDGLGVAESALVFAVSPGSVATSAAGPERRGSRLSLLEDAPKARERGWRLEGDVVAARGFCLDLAVWRLGGAAVPLRLVQLARTGHELSRALGVLAESVRNSWANAADMERIRGYEILAHVLREKAALVNVTSFEILFEALGMNFRHPDQSTITNLVGYRAIALDFELWARTRPEIQVAFLDHFSTLLLASKFRRFNAAQRLAKLHVVRKLLFVLHTRWFAPGRVPDVLKALGATLTALPDAAEGVKPLIAFLAAGLHDDVAPLPSPRSTLSVGLDPAARRDKAEQALALFVALAGDPECYVRFAGALPLARVALLLLGDRPSPFVAAQVLRLLGTCLRGSTGFARKFELVSGWSILKTVLPRAWDPAVHRAAFDVMLGRHVAASAPVANAEALVVACPYIVPAVFTSLRRGLETVASQMTGRRDSAPSSRAVSRASSRRSSVSLASSVSISSASRRSSSIAIMPATITPAPTPPPPSELTSPNAVTAAEVTVEALVEELIGLHSGSATFRQVFRSSQTTAIFVDAYKFFVGALGPTAKPRIVRLLEKLTHFALTLALDPDVSGTQKREILDTLSRAEAILDAGAAAPTAIDPALVGDSRALHRRILSSRLSLQVGERAVLKSFAKVGDWRRSIASAERKRLRKHVLDAREHARQVAALDDWATALTSERGLWAGPARAAPQWRLDETEGPSRIRKKLERQAERVLATRVGVDSEARDVQAADVDSPAVLHAEAPPWAEAYELSSTDIDDQEFAEEVVDDKHRRVRHELEPGDTIEAVDTVARIAGVDSSPGLLIMGKTHVYMLDGLVESDDGEIIDAHDAPKHLFSAPGSIVDLDGPQRATRWSYRQVAGFSDRTFIFRDVALELYFKDSRSLLVVFVDRAQRERFNHRLAQNLPMANPTTPATPASFLKTPRPSRASARVFSGFRQDELQTAQRKWQAREISNFTYLSIVNQISGRTPSDATQYPIFPWVIKDYHSDKLDLTSPDVYRDLRCPMGAQNKGRRESAYARYTSLEGVGEAPFHYGTHFSSSMIVCHFLIRLEPYTHMFKTLQGGDWDLPDRLFSDMARAFDSASKDSRGDVRELIPEFYTCPEFLENAANLDFGVMQNTGERINHVKLPPWAKEDPLLFVTINRLALESNYVSEHLPAWIDLIWGYKQQDADSLNCFHPLSYEGAIDLDTITDPLEKEATVGIIHNFGQTPRKIFHTPHPERFHHGLATLPIGQLSGVAEDYQLMARSSRVIKDLGSDTPVRELAIDVISERIIPCPEGFIPVPDRPHEQIGWGSTRLGRNAGGELRALVDKKVVHVVEAAYTTCAAFADSETLATGSSDYIVRLWRVERTPLSPKDPPLSITLTNIMRGHTAEVLCIAASRQWSLLVSGSSDGTAIFWELNRGTYTRSLFHDLEDRDPVTLVAINESTGYVAISSKSRLSLHTVNGRPIAAVDLSAPSLSHYRITALAFLEREFSHVGVLATGGSDGTITLRTWNADTTPPGEKAQWQFVTLTTLKVRDDEELNDFTTRPAVVSLKFVGETLYHGEDTGKVFLWELPE